MTINSKIQLFPNNEEDFKSKGRRPTQIFISQELEKKNGRWYMYKINVQCVHAKK